MDPLTGKVIVGRNCRFLDTHCDTVIPEEEEEQEESRRNLEQPEQRSEEEFKDCIEEQPEETQPTRQRYERSAKVPVN